MARQIVVDIIGNDKKFKSTLDSSTKSAEGFGSKFSSVSNAVKLGAALMASSAFVVGTEVFETGKQFELMDKKAQTVFGASLPQVQKWADTSAAAMGLTSSKAVGLAANFADLLIPMGFTRDEAARMSTNVVGLSGALAEWSGGTRTAAEVSDILGKAMLGEREALKGLGISITEADISARLLAKGQNKLTGELLAQAKALATQELIMEKSVDAQTAFAKGADSGARASAELGAKIESLKEGFIRGLYPAMKSVLEGVSGLFDGLARLQKSFPLLEVAVGTLSGLLLAKLIPALIAMGTAMYASLGPWGLVLGAIVAVTGAIALLNPGLDTTKMTWEELTQAVKDHEAALANVDTAVYGSQAAVYSEKKAIAELTAEMERRNLEADKTEESYIRLSKNMRNAEGEVRGLVLPFTVAGEAAKTAASTIIRAGDNIITSMTRLRDDLSKIGDATGTALWDPQVNAARIGQEQMAIVAAQRVLDSTKTGSALNNQALIDIANAKKNYNSLLLEATTYGTNEQKILAAKNALKFTNEQLSNKKLTAEQTQALNLQKQILTDRLNAMVAVSKTKGADIRDGVIGPLSKMPSLTDTWGKKTVQAYGSGMKEGLPYVWSGVQSIMETITNGMKASSPPVATSPLHNIGRWGRRTIEEYAKGLTQGEGMVSRAVRAIAQTAGAPFSEGIGGVASGLGTGGLRETGGALSINFYGPVYGDDMEDLARKLAFRLRTVGV